MRNQNNSLIKLTKDGRVTIPKDILTKFDLRGDDYVWVESAATFIKIVPIKFAPKFEDSEEELVSVKISPKLEERKA